MSRHRFPWNMPYEIDPAESDIVIEFTAEEAEPMTRDYPGSDATVEIDRVTQDGVEIEVTTEMLPYLEAAAWNYLESLYDEADLLSYRMQNPHDRRSE